MDVLICEVAGISVVTISAFLLTKYVKMRPIESKSEDLETLRFISIPVGVYTFVRLYFCITLLVARKGVALIPTRFQKTGFALNLS